MEETTARALWRESRLSALEQQWASEQRQLRTRLITDDSALGFQWTNPMPASKWVSAASGKGSPSTVAAAAAAATTPSTSLSPSVSVSASPSTASPSTATSSLPPLRLIGGVDISFVGDEQADTACAALVVLEYPSFKLVYEDYEMVTLTAPYISGFLAFREVEHSLKLLQRLREKAPELMPQLLCVDGNGTLHHRGFGTASHFGVLANLPTIGIGKTLLCVDGLQKSDVQSRAAVELRKGGDRFDLIGQSGAIFGACLRATDTSSNPIFVSVGHRISLVTACQIAHACCVKRGTGLMATRIPEPVRLADLNSREFIRKWKAAQGSANAPTSVSTAAAAPASATASTAAPFAPMTSSSRPTPTAASTSTSSASRTPVVLPAAPSPSSAAPPRAAPVSPPAGGSWASRLGTATSTLSVARPPAAVAVG